MTSSSVTSLAMTTSPLGFVIVNLSRSATMDALLRQGRAPSPGGEDGYDFGDLV